MSVRFLLLLLVANSAGSLLATEGAGAPLDVSKFDRAAPFGVIDKSEAAVIALHQNDPIAAKLDTDFDGKISDEEALAYAALQRVKATAPTGMQANMPEFLKDRSVEEVQHVITQATPKKPDPCDPPQRFFIRRNRLDTFQYGESIYATNFAKGDAKGAAVSATRDVDAETTAVTVNGRVSYLVALSDFNRHCAKEDDLIDPYSVFPTPDRTFIFGYAVAGWVDAQGTLTERSSSKDSHSLQVGVDAQATLGGYGLFDYQTVVATPYVQTDLRGEALAGGVTLGWEPLATKWHLGGRIGRPNRYVDWFWQLRSAADLKWVAESGATKLEEENYGWLGAIASLRLNFFPNTSYFAAPTPKPPAYWSRLYMTVAGEYFWDAFADRSIWRYDAELGYHLSDDGKTSASIKYTHGTDKDTLENEQKIFLGLNVKF